MAKALLSALLVCILAARATASGPSSARAKALPSLLTLPRKLLADPLPAGAAVSGVPQSTARGVAAAVLSSTLPATKSSALSTPRTKSRAAGSLIEAVTKPAEVASGGSPARNGEHQDEVGEIRTLPQSLPVERIGDEKPALQGRGRRGGSGPELPPFKEAVSMEQLLHAKEWRIYYSEVSN